MKAKVFHFMEEGRAAWVTKFLLGCGINARWESKFPNDVWLLDSEYKIRQARDIIRAERGTDSDWYNKTVISA